MKLSKRIEALREELYKSINENGINAKETMQVSKELDKLLQEYLDSTKIDTNKEMTNYDIGYENLKKITKQFGEFPSVKSWNKYAKENILLSSCSMQYISGLNWNKLRTKIFAEIKKSKK